MTDLEPIARQIDRLVWAVSDLAREQHRTMPAASKLKAATFGPLLNLLPLRQHLTEPLIRRRYIYRPEAVMNDFLSDLVASGMFTRDQQRFVPTDQLPPVVDEVNAELDKASRDLWYSNEERVHTVSQMASDVLNATQGRHGLVEIAQTIDEASDPFHRCWQRLTGLRLVRNEAHVDAWQAFDLSPTDIEVLTDAWAGTTLQAPITHSANLRSRGYIADGAVTSAGLDVRRQIEEATDAGIRAPFDVIDSTAFLEILRTLPPHG